MIQYPHGPPPDISPPEPEGPIGDPIPPDEGTHTWETKPDIDYIDYVQDKYDLTNKERRQLHDMITGQGLTKEEIEELAKGIKDMRDQHNK